MIPLTPTQLVTRARRRYDIARDKIAQRRKKAHADGLVTRQEAAAIKAAEREAQQALKVLEQRKRQAAPDSVSDRGVAFVAGFEGFRARPYRDAVGVWTIGYGETIGVTPGTGPWTREHALHQLRKRLDRDYLAPVLSIARTVDLELSQGEMDALASLSYNLGPGVFQRGRTIGDALRSKNRRRIADAFLVYDKAGGRALPGLTRRRRAERQMFLNG